MRKDYWPISFHVMFGPMLKAQGSDDERGITLAIHAAVPISLETLIVTSCKPAAAASLARRFEWAKPVWQGKIQPNHRSEAPLQIERPIR